MKATELRIGNYIKDQGGKTLRIDWFERDKVCQQMMIGVMEVHPMTEHFDMAKPIPLTEEWLLKLGFMKKGSNDNGIVFENPNSVGLWIMEENPYERPNEFYLDEYYDTKIYYVHQLQNLYFALTNTELILK